MSRELLRVTAGRPTFVEDRGGRVCIAVHDEFFRRIRADFRQRLKLAHPDMTPAYHWPRRATVSRAHVARRGDMVYHRRAASRPAMSVPKPNRGERFRRIQTAYETWQRQEKAWYARYGLTPPQ